MITIILAHRTWKSPHWMKTQISQHAVYLWNSGRLVVEGPCPSDDGSSGAGSATRATAFEEEQNYAAWKRHLGIQKDFSGSLWGRFLEDFKLLQLDPRWSYQLLNKRFWQLLEKKLKATGSYLLVLSWNIWNLVFALILDLYVTFNMYCAWLVDLLDRNASVALALFSRLDCVFPSS